MDERADNLAVGNLLGHYRVLQKLGAGGMGEVYLAEDSRLLRKIALKVLPENIAKDKDRLRRFEQEAFAASALNHPNILTIYEFGAEAEMHFLAAEFVDGETLRERIKREPCGLREILDVAAQVAAALNAAHTAKIVHRDIKPENIMLREDGLVKVLDFGLAKLIEKKTEAVESEDATRAQVNTAPGMLMGTVNYMSPEQARGKETDARSDVWSLGVVLYEMLAGQTPFAGETTTDTLAAILHREPAPLSENPPPELARIIRKTLQKDKNERYQTSKDLLIDLKNLKRELEFAEEIERSNIPAFAKTANAAANQSSENATAIHPAAISTQNSTAPQAANSANNIPGQTSSAEYIAGEVRKHKFVWLGILITIIALTVGGYFAFFARRAAFDSIAVLPFVNESGNADNEYLSDGMTETLIGSLSQIPKLNVKARSSVFRYKGKETDLQKIAGELNVQAILTGRVLQRGEQLVLNLELVDAKTENVLWSEQYTRKQADLVSLQGEIVRDVSNKLQAKLSGAEQNQVAKNYTTNTEAYQLYLQGRFYWNKRSPDGFRKAIEYFKQAIAIDPNYALAYTGLADSYGLLPIYDRNVKATETMPQAKEAALKALSLDDNLAEAHASFGAILDIFDYDWAGSEQHYRRAIQLNPNAPSPHQWLGEMLVNTGRFDEGLAEVRRAIELDPFSLIANMALGIRLNSARRYDEALIQLQKTLALDPNFADTNYFLFETYANKKMYAEAVAAYVKQKELDGDPITEIEAMKAAFAKSGWQGFLRHRINYLEAQPRVSRDELAGYYARVGDKDKAIASLEKAYEERSEGLTFLKVDARYDNLRDDPRFQDLLRRVGLPR